MNPRSVRILRFMIATQWLLCGLFALAALRSEAQPLTPADGNADLQQVQRLGREWLDAAASQLAPRAGAGQSPLRLQVELGELDSRLRLAPCAKVEPYVPTGLSLWGNTRLGLRCADGRARWNVFLPLTVRAFGPGWVLRTNIAPGGVLGEQDIVAAEVDWAAQTAPVIVDKAQAIGLVATTGLNAGQTLRAGMLRAPQAFAPGSSVRVVVQGPGFGVTTDGYAITPGYVGQDAKIRTENGRILSGRVIDERTVRIAL